MRDPEAENLFRDLPDATAAEVFTEILRRPGVTLERIVSNGQATPHDQPMVQGWDEWVLLLEGEAGLRIGETRELTLRPGDHLLIGAHEPHWVTWTAPDRPTVWLVLHLS